MSWKDTLHPEMNTWCVYSAQCFLPFPWRWEQGQRGDWKTNLVQVCFSNGTRGVDSKPPGSELPTVGREWEARLMEGITSERP